jgi:hypothetical protein
MFKLTNFFYLIEKWFKYSFIFDFSDFRHKIFLINIFWKEILNFLNNIFFESFIEILNLNSIS